MNIPHRNYDPVFKEALVLFKDKSLDFLGLIGIAPIEDSLSAETVEIDINWEFIDLAFSTKDGRGIHFEEEVDLSPDDLLRFGGYNINLSRVHKREFVTVIFVKNPTTLNEVKTEQLHFSPRIVQCSKIDADHVLSKLKKAVSAGEPINELEAIYLPLFNSKELTPTDLFMESAGLIKAMQTDDNRKRKMLALLITLSGKIVERQIILDMAEEVRNMGNVIIEVFEEIGEKRGAERREEEIARKMLSMGMDTLDIIEATGLSTERIRKMRESLRSEAV
jgi:hypothetical protein